MDKVELKEIIETTVKCDVGSKKSKTTKYYLTQKQQRLLRSEVSQSASYLFENGYVARVGNVYKGQAAPLDDETMAYLFLWSTSKAKKARLELQRAGYIHTAKGKLDGINKTTITYIGKEAVENYKLICKNNISISLAVSSCDYETTYDAEIIETEALPAPTENPNEPSDEALNAFK